MCKEVKQAVRFGAVVLSFLLLFLFMSAGLPRPAQAAPGDLDTSFGTGGKVTTDFASGDSIGWSAAIQPDGKIVVAGFAGGVYSSTTDRDFALARYNTDGSLDMSFGTSGKVTTDFAFGSNDRAHCIAIQADGKIVAAGTGGSNSFALVRYNFDGILDTSFGSGGKVLTPITGFSIVWGLALQADGKIVAVGEAAASSGAGATAYYFALARYNTDGSLDASFGTDGKVLTSFASGDAVAWSVAIQADGKIVAAGVAGGVYSSTPDHDFALARYNTDGSLDTTFGAENNGKVTTKFLLQDGAPPTAQVYSVAIQADGKIVAAGRAGNAYSGISSYDFALARYNTDGSPDTNFGTGGQVMADFTAGEDSVWSVAIQADGKIVAAGDATNGATGRDFALARYNLDGSLDAGFGNGGKLTTDFASGDDLVRGVVIPADGKIVAVGNAYNGTSGNDFALGRYLGNNDESAEQLIIDLINTVNSMNIKQSIKNSLNTKLQAVLDAVRQNDTATACSLMNSFIKYVSTKSGKGITADKASELIAATSPIKAALGCP